MNGRTIHLFPQANETLLGLMPVPVLENPREYPLEVLRREGTVMEPFAVKVLEAHYPKQNVTIPPSIATLKPSPGEQESVTDFRAAVSPTRYWQDRMQLPLLGCLTSPFGAKRYLNGKATGDFHAGLDQRGKTATPIHAIAAGDVKLVRNFSLRGGTVAIDHGQGVESIYMHMSRTSAHEGDHVEAGGIIGYVGETGRANGPHLHWTLYVNRVPVNPAQWMKLPPPCGPSTATRRKSRKRRS
jgi:murein DD-endopeptidase MepM/ murein hydrolase activator NlpD